MRAINCKGHGGTDILEVITTSIPKPGPDQLLVRVKAAALNRADLLQRQGKYPPPVGESPILGLELAGEVSELGENVQGFKIGDRVFGLVAGGAYADYCLLHQDLAFHMPENLSFIEAAAIAEAGITAHATVFELGQLQAGEAILIHAAGSGIGTMALQMAKLRGAQAYVTAGTPEKLARLLELGATAAINYKTQDFVSEILSLTQQTGVDLIMDFIGGSNTNKNLSLLKGAGRLIQIATMGGAQAEIDLRLIMSKLLQLKGFILRSRPLQEKIALAQSFKKNWSPAIAERTLLPIIDSVFQLEDVKIAHQRMQDNRNFGKIILLM